MRQKLFLSLICTIFPIIGLANSTINVMYNSNDVSKRIDVYSQGELVEYHYSGGSFTKLADGISYTYITENNHLGKIVNGEAITLYCAKINIQLVDNEGNPVSGERVCIYEDGDLIASEYSDNDGYAIFYLKQSDKYAYLCDYGEGGVGSTIANQQTDIVINCNILEIVPKYGDVPIPGTYYLHSSTYKSSSKVLREHTDGILKFKVINDSKYVVKDKYGVFSKEITVNDDGNNRYYLEHYKVTFISNSADPNILKNFKVEGESGESKITDGKGYVVYYLLPGEYTYSHLAGNGIIVVQDKDQVVNFSTSNVKLSFNSTTNFSGKQFSVTDESGQSSTFTTDNNGNATIPVLSSNFYININDIGYYSCSVSNQEIQIPVYTFRINSNTPSRISIKDEQNQYLYTTTNADINLIGGKYKYCINYGTDVDFVLNEDLVIDANSYKFHLTAIDKKGLSVTSSYQIYKDGNYVKTITTDAQGKVTVELPQGSYEIRNIDQISLGHFTILNEDINYQLEENCLIRLKAVKNGALYNGTALISKDMSSTQSISFIEGVGSKRLDEGEYFIYTSGPYIGQAKISIFDNVVIEFAELNLSSEGNGLAFPCTFYENTSYNVIKGQNIRFAAVPMAGYKCDYWEINGQIYNTDMVEYQITEDKTTAVAHFTAIDTNIQDVYSTANALSVQVLDNHLVFPNRVEGLAKIFNSAGVLEKEIYIVSDSLNVSDLSTGVYILTLSDNSQLYVSKFKL